MALETELSNYVTVDEEISAKVVPAYVAKSVTFPFVMTEVLSEGKKTHRFPVYGTVAAATKAESASATKQELTDSEVDVSITQSIVPLEQSGLAAVVLGSSGVKRIVDEASSALAVAKDAAVLALAASVTNVVGTTATALDEDDILDALALLGDANSFGVLTGFIAPRQTRQLRNAFKANAAVSFNSVAQTGLENGQPNAQKWVGKIMGINFYESTGVYDDATDRFGLIIDPFAIGMTIGNGGEVLYMEEPDALKTSVIRSLSLFYGVGIIKQAGAVALKSGRAA